MAATLLWAKPARRGALVVTQEDGTEIVVYQHGDERFHWTTNEAGEWIEQEANGKWQRVAALSDEQIQASGVSPPLRRRQWRRISQNTGL